MRKKYLSVALVAVFLAVLIPTGIASAHVLQTDGDIGGVLHINPDDAPVSGQDTNYVISFQDTSNRFTLDNCLCGISIKEGSETVSSTKMVVSSDIVTEDHFTFPKPDIYTLIATGKPKRIGDFQPFKLIYTIRVTGLGSSTSQTFPFLFWAAILIDLLFVLVIVQAKLYTDE
jgi:hypothetical protein